jgi:hypothetical protein
MLLIALFHAEAAPGRPKFALKPTYSGIHKMTYFASEFFKKSM